MTRKIIITEQQAREIVNSPLFQVVNDLLTDGVSVNNQIIMHKYGLNKLTLTKKGNVVTINMVSVSNQNQGNGTRFMTDLVNVADKNGWILVLSPDDSFGATSMNRLKNFYKRFGFRENKGRNMDFSINTSMIRPVKNAIYESIDELNLYHGTNADFNRFSEDFFLSGVGQMAMGWGVYLTNSLNTAKAYSPGGQVMTVQVPDGKYLDSKRRPKEAMGIALKFKKYFLSTEYGKSAYGDCEDEFWNDSCLAIAKCPDGNLLYGTVATLLGSDKEASQWLRSIGYVGLRFYSTNVNTGEKSVNYVIFDVNDVKIINKQQTDSLN